MWGRIVATLGLALALAACGGGDSLPEPAELTLTAEDVAEWTPEKVEQRVAELEGEIEHLDLLKERAEAELAIMSPNPWATATHLGNVTITDHTCAEAQDSGFSDILSAQPILRDGNGNALGSFTPINPTTIGANCFVGMAMLTDDLPELPLYELDMGRRGEFVITDTELALQSETDEDGATYTWFELTIG